MSAEVMVLGEYRLAKISKIGNDSLLQPIKYGLGLEKQCGTVDGKPVYYVIMFIHWCYDNVKLEVVGDRILDIPAEDWDDFRKMIQRGINIVTSANIEHTHNEEE